MQTVYIKCKRIKSNFLPLSYIVQEIKTLEQKTL